MTTSSEKEPWKVEVEVKDRVYVQVFASDERQARQLAMAMRWPQSIRTHRAVRLDDIGREEKRDGE